VSLTYQERFAELIELLRANRDSDDVALVERAFAFAEAAHVNQRRKDGSPYIGHPVEVAHICYRLRLDTPSIAAALLHDTVEDTSATLESVREEFGDHISSLVHGLTKVTKEESMDRELVQVETYRRMLMRFAETPSVIAIKLADRLHNMRTLTHMSAEGQRRIATETERVYAPFADRLGMHWVKVELEDLAFRYLNPDAYRQLAADIAETRTERQKYVDDVIEQLTKIVEKSGIKGEVTGRPKHLYSIYKKMQKDDKSLDRVLDLTAFRVIVDDSDWQGVRDVEDKEYAREYSTRCFVVVAHVHNEWDVLQGTVKDYLTRPKRNGYRSVHTTVFGPNRQVLEVQVRSTLMHELAEYGVAAHFEYKSGTSSEAERRYYRRLHESLRQSHFHESGDIQTDLSESLCVNEVYVKTPRGDVKELQEGATALDFAYAVHTGLGDRAFRIFVNDVPVPFSYPLRDGDVVRVEKKEDRVPRREWLGYVKTDLAKRKIQSSLRASERQSARESGRRMVADALYARGARLADLEKKGAVRTLISDLRCQNEDVFWYEIGTKKIALETVVNALATHSSKIVQPAPTAKPRPSVLTGPVPAVGAPTTARVVLPGQEGAIDHSFASCCNPKYGEPIVGLCVRSGGFRVHSAKCQRILEFDPDLLHALSWMGQETVIRGVEIETVDRPGVLRLVTNTFIRFSLNIERAVCQTTEQGAVNLFHVRGIESAIDGAVQDLRVSEGINCVNYVSVGTR